MSGRCTVHDLAAGPDGRCALCRRGEAPPPAPASNAGWIGVVVGLGILVLAVVGAVGWKTARELGRAVRERQEAQARADASAQASVAAAATNDAEVRLFVTAWCPHCKRAKAWMAQERVDYVEIDVEKTPAVQAEFRRLNPRGGVPTLAVNGEVVVGFSPESYQAAIARPGKRR